MEERARGPGERIVPGPPAAPRPAAGVALLRDGGDGPEVLLVRRTEAARFMPGVWVFPGGAVEARDGVGTGRFAACARRELHEEAGIELPATAELTLFCRWITPEALATRFDARFFLARAPAGAAPRPDGDEAVDAAWARPAEALDAAAAGELALSFPTRSQLGMLAGFGAVEEALAHFRGRPVEPILPKPVGEGERLRMALPGDPDYPG